MNERRRGFTLIELMVAVVIFLLFAGSVYGMYTAASMAMSRAEETEEVTQTGRVLLGQLCTELTCAYQSATAVNSQLIGEDTEETDSEFQRDKITFYTTAHRPAGTEPAGDVTQVVYGITDATEDNPAGLYVQEFRTPGLEASTEEPALRVVSPRVVGLNIRYLPANADDWVDEWKDQTTLPVAVRIELTLRAEREDAKPVLMVTTANLMMATLPSTGGTNGP